MNVLLARDIYFYFMCMCIVCMCVGAPVSCNACGFQKKELDPLELELHTVANYHVGVENQTLALCKNSYCS